MPHPYLNDAIAMFGNITKEDIKNKANFKFTISLYNHLENSPFFKNIDRQTLLKSVSQCKIDLTDDLTDDEIDSLAVAMCTTINSVIGAYVDIFSEIYIEDVIEAFDWTQFSMNLN